MDSESFYNNSNGANYGTPDNPAGTNSKLASASMIIGLISLALLFTFIFSSFSIPLGALGLVFAFMSTRAGKGVPTKAKTGILASSIGLGVGIILTVVSFVTVVKSGMLGSLLNTYSAMYEQMYGEEIDWNNYGFNFEDFAYDKHEL